MPRPICWGVTESMALCKLVVNCFTSPPQITQLHDSGSAGGSKYMYNPTRLNGMYWAELDNCLCM